MALTKSELVDLYRLRAAWYDFTANLYYLIGLREIHYRKAAVAALGLKAGDTVVEIGCGTGLNFRYLREAVGEQGRVIGVDLTDAMLARAEQRIAGHGWRNFALVQSDAAVCAFPSEVQGVLSTFALTLVPEYEAVIARAAAALAPGGRLAVLDLRRPAGWPLWLLQLAVLFAKPFGVSLDLAERKPWESMKRHFPHVETKGFFGGIVYLAVGGKA
jgi:demethylmenaquinone methyltransferase/2-methoxy-6-polyprenyl-1,4-benzoquinol methylase